jgi:hypothetical protein
MLLLLLVRKLLPLRAFGISTVVVKNTVKQQKVVSEFQQRFLDAQGPFAHGPHLPRTFDFSGSRWLINLKDFSGSFNPDVSFVPDSTIKLMCLLQKGYLDRVNEWVKEAGLTNTSIFHLIQLAQHDLSKALLLQYASQAWNMDFFLSNLKSPAADRNQVSSVPSEAPASNLILNFGSVDAFKTQVWEVIFLLPWYFLVC